MVRLSRKEKHFCQNGNVRTSKMDLNLLTSAPNSSIVEIFGMPTALKGYQSGAYWSVL